MVTFYELNDAGVPTRPVLYLDTLKVSTIEQTAESSDARGGKGNAKLISWDYNKEINVTLEDALFSARSLAIMFGDGTTADWNYTGSDDKTTTASTKGLLMKTERFKAKSSQKFVSGTTGNDVSEVAALAGWSKTFTGPDGKVYTKLNPKFYDVAKGNAYIAKSADTSDNVFVKDSEYFCTYDIKVGGLVIDVSANSFPGTLMDRAPLWGI